MDRKTLEYLEDRAGKARAICDKIEKLAKNIAIVEGSYQFEFSGLVTPGYVIHASDEMVKNMKSAYVEAAKKQLEELEQRLAEL